MHLNNKVQLRQFTDFCYSSNMKLKFAAGKLSINKEFDLEMAVMVARSTWQQDQIKKKKPSMVLELKLSIVTTGLRAFSLYNTEVRFRQDGCLPLLLCLLRCGLQAIPSCLLSLCAFAAQHGCSLWASPHGAIRGRNSAFPCRRSFL